MREGKTIPITSLTPHLTTAKTPGASKLSFSSPLSLIEGEGGGMRRVGVPQARLPEARWGVRE